MKTKLLPLAMLVALPSLGFAEPASIIERLNRLELQGKEDALIISELHKKIDQLRSSGIGTANVDSQSSGELQVQKLKDRIDSIEVRNKRQVSAIKRKLNSNSDRLQIKGFASVYGTKASLEGITLDAGVDNNWRFSPDTVAGLQFNYKLQDDIDAVFQITAKGGNGFDMEAEWAFLRFRVNDKLSVRGGRMRLPWYMYSESIEVGYAYPWVRPPVEVYITSFTTYEGVDATYQSSIGDWNTSTQMYYGTANTDVASSDAVTGLAFNVDKDDLTLRASYHYLKSLSINGYNIEDDVTYYSLSGRYDNGKVFAYAEATNSDIGKKLPFIGNYAANITLGYQFEDFMPYVGLSKAYSGSKHEEAAFSPLQKISLESYTLGLRYNLSSQVSLKAEFASYDNFNGTFGNSVLGAEPSLNSSLVQDLNDEGVDLFSVGFDAVF